ncbi:MAG: hypothetical protein L6R36_002221 [Xanthoria steineri]|nr:MAG: hypothetical protein L6R36_002221 [Xanthoria steineri]
MKRIRVPGSTANLGPGFDVLGLALKATSASQKFSVCLELYVEQLPEGPSVPGKCEIICKGEGAGTFSTACEENLVTKVALYVLRSHGIRGFPSPVRITMVSGIPSCRGLGSSAAAVVAGVMLGNEIGHLNLSKERMFDYCLVVERHPDNVGAACYGGFIGAFMKLQAPPSEPSETLSNSLDEPPKDIASYHQFSLNTDVKMVVIIPDFHLATTDARGRLPQKYSLEDAVFNAQRCSLLPGLLGETPLNPAKISEAMRDRLHQPYRMDLIPGFERVLQTMEHEVYPGLLGVCLSGAGPSILALATSNFERIAEAVCSILREAQDIRYDWQVLEVDHDGATCCDVLS